jgi:hypothetical protein
MPGKRARGRGRHRIDAGKRQGVEGNSVAHGSVYSYISVP